MKIIVSVNSWRYLFKFVNARTVENLDVLLQAQQNARVCLVRRSGGGVGG